MPRTPKRPCRYAGCPNLCEHGVYCKEHQRLFGDDTIRGGADARGYDASWCKARTLFLRQHPLCVECRKEGKLTPATVVDHIIPHRGDKALFWDINNWQPLCATHHNKKTGSGL